MSSCASFSEFGLGRMEKKMETTKAYGDYIGMLDILDFSV